MPLVVLLIFQCHSDEVLYFPLIRKIVDKEKSPRQNKKQKREDGEERPANFIVFNVYRNLIHVGYPENNTMVSD